MAETIPAGLKIDDNQLKKAVDEGSFVRVDSNARTATTIKGSGMAGMFSRIAKGTPKAPPRDFVYLFDVGIAGTVADVRKAMSLKNYSRAQIKEALASATTVDNYMEEGTDSRNLIEGVKLQRAANRQIKARDVENGGASSGKVDWQKLRVFSKNISLIKDVNKNFPDQPCTNERASRKKKNQFDGLLKRIASLDDNVYLTINNIDKPENKNKSIPRYVMSNINKIQGAVIQDRAFPFYGNKIANLKMAANAYKKAEPIPELKKLSDKQVDQYVAQFIRDVEAYKGRTEAGRRAAKTTGVPLSSLRKTTEAKRMPVLTRNTASKPKRILTEVAEPEPEEVEEEPEEEVEEEAVDDEDEEVMSPRGTRKTQVVRPGRASTSSSRSSGGRGKSPSRSLADDDEVVAEGSDEDEVVVEDSDEELVF